MIGRGPGLAVGVLVLLGLVSPPRAAQAQSGRQASPVVVVPFETATLEPRSYWLGEGSAVILTDSLRAFGVPVLRRDERLRAFELLRVPAVAGLSRATAIRVSEVIGASQLIVGSVELVADTLTVRAHTILIASAETRPEVVESGPLETIFEVYDRLARRLVPGAAATREQLEASHPPIAAFEQYIKGLLAQSPRTRLSFLREALRLSPTLQRARVAAWEVHNELGEHARALADVRPVPTAHRLGRQARFLESISLIQLERYQDAFTLLTKLNQEESDAALLNNLGVVQIRRSPGASGARAVSYFSDAAEREDVDAFFNLGYAYWLSGDASSAVHWLRETVRRNPADHAAHYVLAAALDAVGSSVEASRERELAKRLSSAYAEWEGTPHTTPVPTGLERLQSALGQPASSSLEQTIEAAGQRDQQELAAFHLSEARRAYDSQRDLDAIAALNRVIYLTPYDDRAHALLARAYMRVGRIPEAVSALKISIWSHDTDEARLLLSDVLSRTGAIDEARDEARVVLDRHPTNAEARGLLDRLGRQ